MAKVVVDDQRIREFIGRRRAFHFNVNPRYTPGSPAQVREPIAKMVAREEAASFDYFLAGRHGEEKEMMARQKGLLGIVELLVEDKKRWHVLDLITGEVTERPLTRH
jgi:hypothetical protein